MKNCYRLGSDVVFYKDEDYIKRNGKNIHLRPQEAITLNCLLDCKTSNRIATFKLLGDAIWEDDNGYDISRDGAVREAIGDLRKKIGKELIKNIRGSGYELRCSVKKVEANKTDELEKPTEESEEYDFQRVSSWLTEPQYDSIYNKVLDFENRLLKGAEVIETFSNALVHNLRTNAPGTLINEVSGPMLNGLATIKILYHEMAENIKAYATQIESVRAYEMLGGSDVSYKMNRIIMRLSETLEEDEKTLLENEEDVATMIRDYEPFLNLNHLFDLHRLLK